MLAGSVDFSHMRLGCTFDTTRVQPRRLVGAIPEIDSYSPIVGQPIVKGFNDLCGDCAETAAFNVIQTRMARDGNLIALPDTGPLTWYSQLTGYNPDTGANDNGTDPTDLFAAWRQGPVCGYNLVELDVLVPTAEGDIRHKIEANGAAYLIVDLSIDQQKQTIWMPTGKPGSWGRHACVVYGFGARYYRVLTWGQDLLIDRSYFQTPGYVVGAFAPLLQKAAV